MSAKTYKAHALVLRKTKLGEKDLIVTMLDESGELLRVVAKGARKPGGSFSARLELFSEVSVMLAQGRSLDVVCETRLLGVPATKLGDVERTACAAPLAELLCEIAQPDLPQPRVFAMSKAAFETMFSDKTSSNAALSIASASLWKVMSQAGFRPSFKRCSLCGDSVFVDRASRVVLSVADGGVVCERCPRPADALLADANAIQWCEAFVVSRYDDIVEMDVDTSTGFATLHLARLWAHAHTGHDLKSLDFLFTSGLFS